MKYLVCGKVIAWQLRDGKGGGCTSTYFSAKQPILMVLTSFLILERLGVAPPASKMLGLKT
jgi:hypothetical protein